MGYINIKKINFGKYIKLENKKAKKKKLNYKTIKINIY